MEMHAIRYHIGRIYTYMHEEGVLNKGNNNTLHVCTDGPNTLINNSEI